MTYTPEKKLQLDEDWLNDKSVYSRKQSDEDETTDWRSRKAIQTARFLALKYLEKAHPLTMATLHQFVRNYYTHSECTLDSDALHGQDPLLTTYVYRLWLQAKIYKRHAEQFDEKHGEGASESQSYNKEAVNLVIASLQ